MLDLKKNTIIHDAIAIAFKREPDILAVLKVEEKGGEILKYLSSISRILVKLFTK